jgi:photosynthetic reaction center cytochrome c subunit
LSEEQRSRRGCVARRMQPDFHHGLLGAAGLAILSLVSVASVRGQAGMDQKPPMAEEVFKNVQVLKGIPVNQFMGTMGIFSAALGFSCEDCHTASDRGWDVYAIDTNPKKRTARRMVTMMTEINRANFGGRQVVTCYTCHRGNDRPAVTLNMATLYAERPSENADVIPAFPGAPSSDQVLDKYVQALGGAHLAGVTSFVAKGTSVGYGPEGDKRPFEIFAKAPGQRLAITHTLDGDSATVFDGRGGWVAAPHRPVPVLALTGQDLDGAKLDADLAFPSRIKDALTKWRVGPSEPIGGRDAQVVQGTGANGALATLYFDKESGLLVRQVRYADSPVGRIPTLIDYSDYRDVSGVKMPFQWTVAWLDGQDTVQLTEVRANAAIDAAKFARPASPSR